MTNDKRTLYWAESAAVLYLVAPLFLFFCFYIRPEVGLPGCGFITWCIYSIWKKTHWSITRTDIKSLWIILPISIIWLMLAGNFGGLSQNSDWLKHYAVINFIADHSPALSDAHNGLFEILRYYLGWYLIPGLAVKIAGGHGQILFSSLWILIGIILFFILITRLLGEKIKHAYLIGPIVFILFSGADIIGYSITHFKIPLRFHIECWAGWAQYNANTTTLFWAPPHAISAWLGLSILMQQLKKPVLLPYLTLICSAILFWSPFVAVGLIPFCLAVMVKSGLKNSIMNWHLPTTVIFISLPIVAYLMAYTTNIPHGPIWLDPWVWDHAPHFTWPGYILFLLLEIGAPLIILFAQKDTRNRFLIIATISLILIPLYRVGVLNDFAMRASLPALAFLAIGMAYIIGSSASPYYLKISVILLLTIGSITPIGEVARGFFPPILPANPATTFDMSFIGSDPPFRLQYFSSQPIPILRQGTPP